MNRVRELARMSHPEIVTRSVSEGLETACYVYSLPYPGAVDTSATAGREYAVTHPSLTLRVTLFLGETCRLAEVEFSVNA